jgi:hypothetical protein
MSIRADTWPFLLGWLSASAGPLLYEGCGGLVVDGNSVAEYGVRGGEFPDELVDECMCVIAAEVSFGDDFCVADGVDDGGLHPFVGEVGVEV